MAAALVFLLARGLRAGIAALAPELAVAEAATRPGSGALNALPDGRIHGRFEALDPWGHRLCSLQRRRGRPLRDYYSVGPDGEDELGAGDDVRPSPRAQFWGARLRSIPGAGFSLAIALLYWAFGAWSRPRSRPRRELFRALTPAFVLALVVLGPLSLLTGPDLTPFVEAVGRFSPGLLPAPLACALGYAACCYLAALALRLTRPVPLDLQPLEQRAEPGA